MRSSYTALQKKKSLACHNMMANKTTSHYEERLLVEVLKLQIFLDLHENEEVWSTPFLPSIRSLSGLNTQQCLNGNQSRWAR